MSLQSRACTIALALFAAMPGSAAAAAVNFETCPATIADAKAKLASLSIRREPGSTGTTLYEIENARVLGVQARLLSSKLDDRLQPELAATFASTNKQHHEKFRQLFGDVECFGRSCHWNADRSKAAPGRLASAFIRQMDRFPTAELTCKYYPTR